MPMIGIGNINREPKLRKYLFIDGNYFQRAISSISKRIGPDIEVPIDYSLLGKDFERIIYYDALPIKKSNQTQENFEKEFREKQDFLNNLRLQPKYHVRDGYTRMRPKASGGIEQKGVDTWLAIEVLQYAFRNTIDVAEVITGDLDLYPLFEALVQTNTTGVLHYEKESTSKELIMSVDIAHPITSIELLKWSTNQFRKEYEPGQQELIDLDIQPLNDVYKSIYGECIVRYDAKTSIWQINFDRIGNVFTAKSRLLLIDKINNFLKEDLIPDSAFTE